MGNIVIEHIVDGNIEECRELCNELMAFQQSKAFLVPEVFDVMNFDTRMKVSFENALESQVLLVRDDGVPVGYCFSTVETVGEKNENQPPWAPVKPGEKPMGMFPDWDLPETYGCLSNLYLKEGYRSQGLGSKLFAMAMDWLSSRDGTDLIFIYVSNGNQDALDFYLSHGFTFSHDVFSGFIQAIYKWVKK